MNIKQKIFLIGFFIGLIMVAYLGIDSNKYTRYVVMLGYTISLSCALAYSLSRYCWTTSKSTNKKIESESNESKLLSNIEDQKTIQIDNIAAKKGYFHLFDLMSKDKFSQFDIKNNQYSLDIMEQPILLSSHINYHAYKKVYTPFFHQVPQNNPNQSYTEFIKNQEPFIVVSNKPIKDINRQYSK